MEPTTSLETAGAAPSRVRNPVAAARDVLKVAWDGQLPVKPEQLAQNIGVHVYATRQPGFSGWYHRHQQLIEYDAAEPPVRQRFTIAHELGHHVLGHGDSPRDTTEAFSVKVKEPKERAANQFAAELLMPSDLIRRMVQSGRASSVDQLAKIFGVSKVAMTYRLNNLNLTY